VLLASRSLGAAGTGNNLHPTSLIEEKHVDDGSSLAVANAEEHPGTELVDFIDAQSATACHKPSVQPFEICGNMVTGVFPPGWRAHEPNTVTNSEDPRHGLRFYRFTLVGNAPHSGQRSGVTWRS
jgi:hypothetical protein